MSRDNSSGDNLEEYDDPKLYDMENEPYTDELPFLLAWASLMKGTIIELACGTGRVTIPLAQAGHRLLGVDLHHGMLERARAKSNAQGVAIDWMEQDCTQLEVSVHSPMIYMVGNSFQHFLTNEAQDQLLQGVSRHLQKDGIFIFNTRFPSREELMQPSTEEYWRSYREDETNVRVDVYTISHYNPLEQLQYYTTIRRYIDQQDQLTRETNTHITLRYVYPKEMERLLFVNGFELVHLYEDWKMNPLTADSYQMIYVCRKKS